MCGRPSGRCKRLNACDRRLSPSWPATQIALRPSLAREDDGTRPARFRSETETALHGFADQGVRRGSHFDSCEVNRIAAGAMTSRADARSARLPDLLLGVRCTNLHALARSAVQAQNFSGFVASAAEPVRHLSVELDHITLVQYEVLVAED
jgi:hypothetical protein